MSIIRTLLILCCFVGTTCLSTTETPTETPTETSPEPPIDISPSTTDPEPPTEPPTDISPSTTDPEPPTEPSSETPTDTPPSTTDPEPSSNISEYTQCPETLTPLDEGICTVTGEGTDLVIQGNILAPDTVFIGGSVRIDDQGTITCIGCNCSTTNTKQIQCPNAVISPGLINPHDHLGFTEGHPLDIGTRRWNHRHEWRTDSTITTPRNPNGNGTQSDGTRWGEMRQVMGGVTSLVGVSYAKGMVRNLDQNNGLEGLVVSAVRADTFPLKDSNGQFKDNCTWDYKYDEQTVSTFSSYIPHVAEGLNHHAAEEFRCQSSSFNGARDFTEPNTTHVHAIGLTGKDLFRMTQNSASIIWSPRSNIGLYGVTADVVSFYRMGGLVALGTDWTYSGSIHSGRELACAKQYNENYLDHYFSSKQLWEMATINAAKALDVDSVLGSLTVGKTADIAIFSDPNNTYHEAVMGQHVTSTALVLRGQTALYGETHIVTELTQQNDCEMIDVCSTARSICAAREFNGTTYSSIASAVSSSYPSFFCDETPSNELSCNPFRSNEFTGNATEQDSDGDGIDNTQDNCPLIFNPIRPMDDGNQSDADQDGIGDPCDSTPVGSDIDQDNINNDLDNCPLEENPDQNDEDNDAKGDRCDACPNTANPTSVCGGHQAVSITSIQDGTIPTGSLVSVENAVITGISQRTLGLQTQESNAPQRGIIVFSSNGFPSNLAVNDIINVTGAVEEYFDNTQISATAITKQDTATTPIEPVSLSIQEASTEPYEGMLIKLTGVTITNTQYDCNADNDLCNDTNLWEASNNGHKIIISDHFYTDSDWDTQTQSTKITGVLLWRFDRWRILPRTSADLSN